VAEGVEQEEQLNYLKRLKVELIQGFYFYKPMPISDVITLSKKYDINE
jgi:EAL domain-containing protein (putative c-di-GMP-specific phosphodiesterase class I)